MAFYKMTYNARQIFNQATTKLFNSFYTTIWIFLFVIRCCSISEYKSRNKVIKFFDEKIT